MTSDIKEKIYHLETGKGPFIAAAIHDGHFIREELLKKMSITELGRLREEDPHTGKWTNIASTRIKGLRSRFEFDLNRPRENAVYINPEDAWNLEIYDTKPTEREVDISLAYYDRFYSNVHKLLSEFELNYGHFVVFDLHSYNHRRNGPNEPPQDPELNPEVNVGTGTMNRDYWAPVVDRFIAALRDFDYRGRKLDVRENIRFRGGYFPRWIHQNFPVSGCALAIEVKKFFMDEWTGKADMEMVDLITKALHSTIPAVKVALENYADNGR